MKKKILELIVGDRILHAGKAWRVCEVKKQKNSLFNITLYNKEGCEKKMLRKVPGAVALEVVE